MSLDIKALARVHTETALRVLVGIMNAEAAPHSARVSAATVVLNRGWGQPHQSVDISGELSLPSVIRAPMIAETEDEWNQHVPPEHRTEH
jgi:hypothetical protein